MIFDYPNEGLISKGIIAFMIVCAVFWEIWEQFWRWLEKRERN